MHLGKGVAASGRWPAPGLVGRARGGRNHCAAHHFLNCSKPRAPRAPVPHQQRCGCGAGAPRQGRWPQGHGRREHQLAAPHRRGHRLLRQPRPPVAPLRQQRRPRCAQRRAGRWHHRRAGVRPQPGGRRRQDPALCRSRARRHRAGAAVSLALKWSQDQGVPLQRRPQPPSPPNPPCVLGTAWVRRKPAWASWSKAAWPTCACSTPGRLDGAGRRPAQPGANTPFSGYELPGCVRATLVGGHVAFERA